MYDKGLAFKIFLYLTIILTITLLTKSHPPDEDDENVDISYQGVNDEMIAITDMNKNNNYVMKRETENDGEKKSSNEQMVDESTGEVESEENQPTNESIPVNVENDDGKGVENIEGDGGKSGEDENNDIENQDQSENGEEQMKLEESNKNNGEGTVNRQKRVNKAGSSHKTRPSLNRLTNYKNKGNSESNSNKI